MGSGIVVFGKVGVGPILVRSGIGREMPACPRAILVCGTGGCVGVGGREDVR